MRPLLYFLFLVPASNFFWRPVTLASHSGCELVPSSAAQQLTIVRAWGGAARRAVRDFTRRAGAPYTCLYFRKAQAHPDQPVCWLLVQQSTTRFMRYSYHAQRVDSMRLEVAGWSTALARMPSRCYEPLCESISTSPVLQALLIKRGPKVQTGILFEDTPYLPDYTPADQARVAPVAAFMRLLDK